jgi:hypothetical protein
MTSVVRVKVTVHVGLLYPVFVAEEYPLAACSADRPTMLTPRHKIKKQDPDALEESVAQALYELQVSSEKLKQSLREVQICSAKARSFWGLRCACCGGARVWLCVPAQGFRQGKCKG